MTRNGKIARLPKAIRERLNQQILDGVPGKDLVNWLNNLDEVAETLARHFNSSHITEQNLSEWKRGGYQEWTKKQERREWVRRLSDDAEDIAEDSGAMPWMERVGALFEVILGRLVERHLDTTIKTPGQLNELVILSRELARHRQLAQAAACWRSEQVKRGQNDLAGGMDDRIEKARHKALLYYMRMIHHENAVSQFTKFMTCEQKRGFEKMLEEKTLEYLVGQNSPGFAVAAGEDSKASVQA